jgi:hypothetical protein
LPREIFRVAAFALVVADLRFTDFVAIEHHSLLNLRQENMSLLTQVLAGGYGTHLLASRQFALAMPRPVQVCLTVPLRG